MQWRSVGGCRVCSAWWSPACCSSTSPASGLTSSRPLPSQGPFPMTTSCARMEVHNDHNLFFSSLLSSPLSFFFLHATMQRSKRLCAGILSLLPRVQTVSGKAVLLPSPPHKPFLSSWLGIFDFDKDRRVFPSQHSQTSKEGFTSLCTDDPSFSF